MKPLPVEAEQLVIQRVTPKTQEVDLHNGGRLTAELIETMSDKLTMGLQEITQQKVEINDISSLREEVSNAVSNLEKDKQDKLPDGENSLIDENGKVNNEYIPGSLQRFFVTRKWFDEAQRPLKPGRYIITDGT